MPDYSDHKEVVKLVGLAQDADYERREEVRREREFLMPIPKAQWDDDIWNQTSGRPRYTFDLTTPVIDLIAGEMERADFGIDVKPAGGDASKDLAQHLDGLIRNIETVSNAQTTYNRSSRLMVIGGLDGWEVVQEYADSDSFDQDLAIRPVHNWIDRVWLDHASEEQDGSDARHAFKLTAVAQDVFDEKYPDHGGGSSLDQKKNTSSLQNGKDVVVCGEIYYLKAENRKLVQMSNGATYDADSEEYLAVADDLAAQGITVKKERPRPEVVQYVRKFDNNDWLGPEERTVFHGISLVPMYGNFEVYESHVLYRGEVCKLMDPQKVFNYTESREIEEGALAPRAKVWMTKGQTGGDQEIMDALTTQNTNSDPVQFWHNNGDDPQPYQMGGASINPGLQNLSNSMRDVILGISGQFAAAQGDNPGLQSGVAIEKLQDKSNTGTIKYFTAREIAQTRTYQLLVKAIPKVYDSARQVRVLGEDGSYEMVTLNQPIEDAATGEFKEPIDFSKGIYDVTCSSGSSFKSKQDQTVAALSGIGSIVPGAVEMNADLLLNNVDAPGMPEAAERMRQQLINTGVVPEEQLTEEEIMRLQQQAQQQQEPDALMVAAQAEMQKAQAEQEKNQVEFSKAQADLELKAAKIQLDQQKLETDRYKAMLEAEKVRASLEKEAAQIRKLDAETEGQHLENAVTFEQLQEMPFDQLLKMRQQLGAGNERQVN